MVIGVVPDHHATGTADRVPQGNRPEVLDRQHERRAAVGQVVDQPRRHRPRRRSERRHRRMRRARRRPRRPRRRRRPGRPGHRPPTAARPVGRRRDPTRSAPTTSSPSRITNTASMILIWPTSLRRAELVGDATFEQVVVREADHERLDGSDGHVAHLLWEWWSGGPVMDPPSATCAGPPWRGWMSRRRRCQWGGGRPLAGLGIGLTARVVGRRGRSPPSAGRVQFTPSMACRSLSSPGAMQHRRRHIAGVGCGVDGNLAVVIGVVVACAVVTERIARRWHYLSIRQRPGRRALRATRQASFRGHVIVAAVAGIC